MATFIKYAAYYDLLYRDKDYVAEADYVAKCLRAARPDTHSILELGSGTGRHGLLLADKGFDVHGVERSAEMVDFANAANAQRRATERGQFACEVADICKLRLARRFDVVIALFHVISYQTTNEALQAVFHVAANHLVSDGIFLFDVWHGPAVLTERPSQRVREVSDKSFSVRRTAIPCLDTNLSTVNVAYTLECENLVTGEKSRFREDHLMRYLFPTEIELFANASGLKYVSSEEFLTGFRPSPATWSVAYVLRK